MLRRQIMKKIEATEEQRLLQKSKLQKPSKLLLEDNLEVKIREITLRDHQLKIPEMFLDLRSLQPRELKLKRKIEVVMIVTMLDQLQEEEAVKAQEEEEAAVIEEEDKLDTEIETPRFLELMEKATSMLMTQDQKEEEMLVEEESMKVMTKEMVLVKPTEVEEKKEESTETKESNLTMLK